MALVPSYLNAQKDALVNGVRSRLLAVVLATVAALAALAVGLLVTGQAAYVVTHGISMKPRYHQGDLVVVSKAPSYHLGEIVAYRAPGEHVVVLHRIVGGSAAGFVMKGDNNQSLDPSKPTSAQILGRAVLHVPQGGIWLQRFTSPVVLGLLAFALVALGGTAAQTRRRRRHHVQRRSSMSPATTPSRFATTTQSLTPAWRTTAGCTAALGVLGVVVAAVGWSAPADKAITATTTGTRAVTFSYSATVPKSAAYDGTKVSFPDPVFRKLANSVDVHYDYRGQASSITLAAKLSSSSGWNVTLPLHARTTATDGDVNLDLNALDARVQAAAQVTGIAPTQVDVDVIATVHSTAVKDFSATLPFSLTTLALTPVASSGKKLTVIDSTAVQHPVQVSRDIHLAGHAIAVRTLREAGVILLLLFALSTGALSWLARRPATSEADRIHRRYAKLLLPVEPLVQASGHPIVDVTDFTNLVRLAERYGLLVLHWNRSGIETFVVQDDGVTYRYRVAADGGGLPQESLTAGMTSRPNEASVAGAAKSANQT
jgi:signal peptidase I